MHTIIYAIVVAESKEDALGLGKSVFDQLVGVGQHSTPVFDYYTTFDDHSSTVSGPARYGEKPSAVPINDPRGARMLHRGWKYTKAEFDRNMNNIREGLETYSNEEIREDIDADMVRYYMDCVGQYRGPSIRLYSEHGEGIRNRRNLDQILEGSDDLWIVPADVHF